MKAICQLILLLFSFFFAKAQPCSIPSSFFADDTIVVCSGTTYTLTAPTIAGATYTWSTGAVTNPVTLTVNGKYWLDINDGICTASDTVTVLFNSFLLSPQVRDLKLCKGQPALPLPVQGRQLQWYAGPIGGIANSTLPVPSTADTGRITYWFSQTIKGCESPPHSYAG